LTSSGKSLTNLLAKSLVSVDPTRRQRCNGVSPTAPRLSISQQTFFVTIPNFLPLNKTVFDIFWD
jgi:hypothetical protein